MALEFEGVLINTHTTCSVAWDARERRLSLSDL